MILCEWYTINQQQSTTALTDSFWKNINLVTSSCNTEICYENAVEKWQSFHSKNKSISRGAYISKNFNRLWEVFEILLSKIP